MKRRTKRVILFALPAVIIAIISPFIYFFLQSDRLSAPKETVKTPAEVNSKQNDAPTEAYKGSEAVVANSFSVKVPNGWNASIADSGTFRAIMFARPEQLGALQYNASSQPVVDRNGIPSWGGLTEHFYVRLVQSGQQFNASSHREVTSESFTFDDGTAGTKYYVVKHTNEAAQYGGLLRDAEWQGRTYVYEKNGRRVEAHLALYPSSNVDRAFYEAVVKSIRLP